MMVWFNGKFINASKACISLFDRGVLFGEGIFETLRCYCGVPFAFREHMKRFNEGCEALSIKLKYSNSDLQNVIKKLLILNGLNICDAYIRITATPGVTSGLRDFKISFPNIFMFCKKIEDEQISEIRKQGIIAETVKFCRGFFSEFKHTSYIISTMALRKIEKSKDVQEAIFLDENNNILEGATSNIFFYRENEILTPPANKKILPGIMRSYVLKVLKKEGFIVKEENISYTSIQNWQGAFITNSIIELLPIKKIDNHNLSLDGFQNIYGIVKKSLF